MITTSNQPPTPAPSNLDTQRARYATLRDELKLKAHLLGMEAKDAFAEIEKAAEHLLQKIEHATPDAFGKLIERMEGLVKRG